MTDLQIQPTWTRTDVPELSVEQTAPYSLGDAPELAYRRRFGRRLGLSVPVHLQADPLRGRLKLHVVFDDEFHHDDDHFQTGQTLCRAAVKPETPGSDWWHDGAVSCPACQNQLLQIRRNPEQADAS